MESRGYLKDSTNAIYAYIKPLREYISKPQDMATKPLPVALTTLTPQPTPTQPTVPKKKRLQTPFLANVTASLALAKKNMEADTQVSLLTSLTTSAVTSVRNMLYKPAPSSVGVIVIPDINKQMEDLEAQAQKMEDPDDMILQKVELARAQIIEHAARRVDVFFYLLLAVKGKFVTVTKDSTVKQHGKGSEKKGTQACHSSLFPNIKLTPIPAPEVKPYWPFSLFSENKSSTPAPISITGTYLEEVLNMTVELPSIVNGFDGHLEGRFQSTVYIRECIDIINRVSKNEIDPIKGINEFLKTMNAFFTHMEYDYIKKPEYGCIKKESQPDLPKSLKKVLEYEIAGTFHAANKETLTITDQYIYLMLRLNRVETIKSMMYSGALEAGYKKIQDEIYSSKNVVVDSSRVVI